VLRDVPECSTAFFFFHALPAAEVTSAAAEAVGRGRGGEDEVGMRGEGPQS